MSLRGQVIGWNMSVRCSEIETNGNLGESSFNGMMRAEANLVDVESKKIKIIFKYSNHQGRYLWK